MTDRRKRLLGRAVSALLSDRTRRAHQAVQARLPGAARKLEHYHRVDDPHSQLLLEVLPGLCARAELTLETVLVAPGGPDVAPQPEMLARYACFDAGIVASMRGLEFPRGARPPPRDAVAEATAIAVSALSRGRPGALLDVGRALFAGDAGALASLRAEHGAATETGVAASLEAGSARLRRRGHYQSGMLRYQGEWYWGVDRLTHLEARLAEQGVDVGPPIAPADRPPGGRHIALAGEADTLELFFSFRSPYSYLALEPAHEVCRRRGLHLVVRPVLPMVMRGMEVPLAKRLYIVRDAKREADRLSIPFGRIVDPVGEGVERCLAVLVHARQAGRERAFLVSACRGIWAEGLDVAVDEDLRRVVERAGLDWAEARASLRDEQWREEVEANRAALFGLGLWGVPVLRLGGLAVWGQDRVAVIDAVAPRRSIAPGI